MFPSNGQLISDQIGLLANNSLPEQNSGFRPDDNTRRDSTSSLTP